MKISYKLITVLLVLISIGCSHKGHDHQHEEATLLHEEESQMHDESVGEEDDHGDLPDGVTLLTLSEQPFRSVTKTGGQVLVDKKDVIVLVAKGPGIVRFSDHFLFPGTEIRKGEEMFSIGSESLTENNISVNYATVKAEHEKAKSDFERASRLLESKSITESSYQESLKEFEIAEARMKALESAAGDGGVTVVEAPEECFLNEVFVEEGEYVEPGDPLARITIKHTMVLRADISPAEFSIIEKVSSARFRTGYSDLTYNTDEMHGTRISYGRSSDENSWFIPVYFRIDYEPTLIPGTFADVWLLGEPTGNAITVPDRAIMEEYGKHYLFVFHDGHFDKRYVTRGASDGTVTRIISGIQPGETIVDEGAYQVKMSLLTSIPNTHDHNH